MVVVLLSFVPIKIIYNLLASRQRHKLAAVAECGPGEQLEKPDGGGWNSAPKVNRALGLKGLGAFF